MPVRPKPKDFGDAPDVTVTVSLSSWREHPLWLLKPYRNEILAFLLQRTAFADQEGLVAITQAAAGHPQAMVAVADLVEGPGIDLAHSWLLAAALSGSDAAKLQLGAVYYQMAGTATLRRKFRESRHYRRCAEACVEHLIRPLASSFDTRHDLFERIGQTGLAWLRTHHTSAETEEEPVPAVDGRPRMTVINEAIPLHRAGRDDKALVAAWDVLTKPVELAAGIDPRRLGMVLTDEFPWMEEPISAIVNDLTLRRRLGLPWFRVRPTLLVGPPGSGKTSFCKRFVQLSGVGYGEISAAGSADNRLLMGTARGWSTTTPAYPLHIIRRTKMANPLILVDEIDKTRADGRNGDIRQTLLGMLEPTTAAQWLDECLTVPADLSAISWVLAANDATPLRGPLLTRLRVIEVPLPAAGSRTSTGSPKLHCPLSLGRCHLSTAGDIQWVVRQSPRASSCATVSGTSTTPPTATAGRPARPTRRWPSACSRNT